MTNSSDKNDQVWKALADRTRRQILDILAERPLTSGELVRRFDDLCRTNVMKHLEILVDANLVIVRRHGRSRWNYLNPVPIQAVCDRWVSQHVSRMASSLSRLRELLEDRQSAGIDYAAGSSELAPSSNDQQCVSAQRASSPINNDLRKPD